MAEKLFVFASISVGELKSISNSIYKIFNVRKNIRGSLLAFGLDSPFLLGTTPHLLAAVLLPGASYYYTLLLYIYYISHIITYYIYIHILHMTHCISHIITLYLLIPTAACRLATTATTTASPALGIEPGPPAWESSTLPNEPPDVHRIHLYFRLSYWMFMHIVCCTLNHSLLFLRYYSD